MGHKREVILLDDDDDDADAENVDANVVEKAKKMSAKEAGGANEQIVCMICMDSMAAVGPHRAATLRCGHIFGSSCIKEWLVNGAGNNKRCPKCNKKARVDHVVPLYDLPQVAATDAAYAADLEAKLAAAERERQKVEKEKAEAAAEAERARQEISALKQQLQREALQLSSTNQQYGQYGYGPLGAQGYGPAYSQQAGHSGPTQPVPSRGPVPSPSSFNKPFSNTQSASGSHVPGLPQHGASGSFVPGSQHGAMSVSQTAGVLLPGQQSGQVSTWGGTSGGTQSGWHNHSSSHNHTAPHANSNTNTTAPLLHGWQSQPQQHQAIMQPHGQACMQAHTQTQVRHNGTAVVQQPQQHGSTVQGAGSTLAVAAAAAPMQPVQPSREGPPLSAPAPNGHPAARLGSGSTAAPGSGDSTAAAAAVPHPGLAADGSNVSAVAGTTGASATDLNTGYTAAVVAAATSSAAAPHTMISHNPSTPSSSAAGLTPTFSLLQAHPIQKGKCFDFHPDSGILLAVENATGPEPGLRRVSALVPQAGSTVRLPPGTNCIRDLKISADGKYAAVATGGWGLLLLSTASGSVVAKYPGTATTGAGAGAWSCAWNPRCQHELYLGLRWGQVAVVDTRKQGTDAVRVVAVLPGPTPVHTVLPVPPSNGSTSGSSGAGSTDAGKPDVWDFGGATGREEGEGRIDLLAASTCGVWGVGNGHIRPLDVSSTTSSTCGTSCTCSTGGRYTCESVAADTGTGALMVSWRTAVQAAGSTCTSSTVSTGAAGTSQGGAYHSLFVRSQGGGASASVVVPYQAPVTLGGHSSAMVMTRGTFLTAPSSSTLSLPLLATHSAAHQPAAHQQPSVTPLGTVNRHEFFVVAGQKAGPSEEQQIGWGGFWGTGGASRVFGAGAAVAAPTAAAAVGGSGGSGSGLVPGPAAGVEGSHMADQGPAAVAVSAAENPQGSGMGARGLPGSEAQAGASRSMGEGSVLENLGHSGTPGAGCVPANLPGSFYVSGDEASGVVVVWCLRTGAVVTRIQQLPLSQQPQGPQQQQAQQNGVGAAASAGPDKVLQVTFYARSCLGPVLVVGSERCVRMFRVGWQQRQ